MFYLMLIYQDDAAMADATPAEQAAIGEGYGKLNAFLAESGAGRGNATWPANVKTIRTTGGTTVASDGTVAETGLRIAGFFLAEAAGMDAATEIAARVPATPGGAVEIRPVQV